MKLADRTRTAEGHLCGMASVQAAAEGYLHRSLASREAVEGYLHGMASVQAAVKGHLRGMASVQAAVKGHLHGALASREAVEGYLRGIEMVSTELARIVEPWGSAFTSLSDWEASLTARMATLRTPWALQDRLDQSMLGFAHLSRLSDALHTEKPYSERVGELVADELGDGVEAERDDSPTSRDKAAIEAGLNPDLIAFPPPAYGAVVNAAGFDFRLPPSPMPQAVESADPDAASNPIHWQVMNAIEQHLRKIVEERLRALGGEKWMKRRVPEQVRRRWLERQEEDRQLGRSVYSAIQYADFMDLADVIGQADNWRDTFEAIFQNRDNLMVSFRRLHPIRKAIAHSRPLVRVDVVSLVSEATQIFKALGLPFLK